MPRKYTEAEWEAAFWARVDMTSDPQGCWLWTGNKCPSGYGSLKWEGKTCKSHRVSYILTGHTVPEGLVLAHSEHCVGKRHCCNPDHLTPKTHSGNSTDMHRDGTMICKLTAEQVLDIRARIGQTQKEIAEEFGVDHTAIYKIIHRKTWAHI